MAASPLHPSGNTGVHIGTWTNPLPENVTSQVEQTRYQTMLARRIFLTNQVVVSLFPTKEHYEASGMDEFTCWDLQIGGGISAQRDSNSNILYYKISGADRNSKYQTHKLSACVNLNIGYTGHLTGFDVSHRCHNSTCWRPSHLCLESHLLNMGRNRCPGWYLNITTRELICFCTHNPHCLNFTVGTPIVYTI
jgi:hypothetical protein